MTHEHEEDDFVVNPSDNRPFTDVLKVHVSRRDVAKGSLAVAATSFFASSDASATWGWWRRRKRKELIGFTPVPVAAGNGPVPTISEEYEYSVLIPWGDPIVPGGPAFDPVRPGNAAQQAEDQKHQVGIGHDGMTFFPRWKRGRWWWYPRNDRGILCLNCEFGINPRVMGKSTPESLDDVRISQHAHGVTIVEIRKKNGQWETMKSKVARRIHANTPVEVSGPVAGHPLLANAAHNEPAGTVNNCANGETPWGTYLTCEENFNGYFGATSPDWEPTEEQARYGFDNDGFNYGWELFDPRFDLSSPDYQNENNRFGWVVEIDPRRPHKKPVKRTALGRFKHENAAVTLGKGGRAVVYMGDDQRFDYVYKFVSESNAWSMRARGKSPLDHGKLYVARFDDDGTGEWLELTIDNPAIATRFNDQAEVLTYARIAADIVGATPMDRPEWISVAPDGWVYGTMTNNSQRTEPNAPNPEAPNNDGHILRWKDTDRFTGTTFKWDIFILASSTRETENVFTDPDGLWADPDGRIFIQTDGGQPDELNNQMLVANPKNGDIRRIFTGVTDDEITGIAVTPDRRTMFINTQHPGNGDPTATNFPAPTDGVTPPRDATIVITRKDGGVIGS
ncbi:MAG: PhoX family phosphatase [Myxococcota bacterium]